MIFYKPLSPFQDAVLKWIYLLCLLFIPFQHLWEVCFASTCFWCCFKMLLLFADSLHWATYGQLFNLCKYEFTQWLRNSLYLLIRGCLGMWIPPRSYVRIKRSKASLLLTNLMFVWRHCLNDLDPVFSGFAQVDVSYMLQYLSKMNK